MFSELRNFEKDVDIDRRRKNIETRYEAQTVERNQCPDFFAPLARTILCLTLLLANQKYVLFVLFLVFVIIVPSSSNSHNTYIGYLVERASMGIEYNLRKQQIADYAAFAKLGEHRPSFTPIAEASLLVYDITINMGREVRLVWNVTDRFRWSNVIYFTNRYPVLAYQIWSVCYTPNIPQASGYRHSLTIIVLNLINLCALRCTLPILLVFFIHPDSHSDHCLQILMMRNKVSWILRVYAVVDHGLVFAIMLSLLGLAIVGFDIFQGVQSSCTHNTLSSETLSGVMTYISLAVFDILATSLVTNRMIQAIRGCGGFRKLARQNLSDGMQLGVLYFGYGFPTVVHGINSDIGMSRVVTIPQIIAVVLYFVGVPLGLYSPILNNFLLVLSSIMIARFLLGLREMNESRRESIPDEASSDQATTLSTYDLCNGTNRTSVNWMNGSTTTAGARRMNQIGRTQWWAGGTSLVADFDAEIEMR
ncbi:hypothetical protein F5876DRAFT_70469 [Lentinula aff. lateritia]|uniref:Uncharacterized protein n=1 Tax=Lentinula aff. lateritia TaxID=2804960 RepID=A0ACC1TIX2_9AGAR|nr:hypothetical protein F5876DRAFT_70469 [Lentinula aff. lateritia]